MEHDVDSCRESEPETDCAREEGQFEAPLPLDHRVEENSTANRLELKAPDSCECYSTEMTHSPKTKKNKIVSR